MSKRVVVIGGGVSGLASAYSLLSHVSSNLDVVLLEANERLGGLIQTSPFAGLSHVDEAADSFLARVPWAMQLAHEVGLGDSIVSPTGAHASVWHQGLHRIPGDLMMGVPASVAAFATSSLFSPRGKARAALEPLLPTTANNDSIGEYVRARFGDEILERLVDPLVGSIYAADTDRFSLAAVPQIAALTSERSMLAAARSARTAAQKAQAVPGQVFGAPRDGMGALTSTLHTQIIARGGQVLTHHAATSIERHNAQSGYVVHTSQGSFEADAVVSCAPARHAAELFRSLHPHSAEMLSQWEHAGVVLITMAIPRSQWPSHLDGSGYLVPKPDQRWVTAASFGSNKWAHWRPDDGSMIVRVSLGRDGLDVMDFDDDKLVNLALADMKLHLSRDFTPSHVRISRWPESFPQYRPHHFTRLETITHALSVAAPGVVLAGASYRGIGIPACIQQARAASDAVIAHLHS